MNNTNVVMQHVDATNGSNGVNGDPNAQQQQQQQTQLETQQGVNESPGIPEEEEAQNLWGYLYPCNDVLQRIDFWRTNPTYKIGRNPQLNQVVLPGPKVSNSHCSITWDGQTTVTITDSSTNGTYVNSRRLRRNETCALRNGDQVGFGSAFKHENPYMDYRFIFRHIAEGRPTTGLYAEYDTVAELGKGSFATVLKAVHRATGEWVAVKQIYETRRVAQGGSLPSAQSSVESLSDQVNGGGVELANLANAPKDLKVSIMREIGIMRNLQHPNITELKTVFFQTGTISLVLELVPGGDLLERIIKKNGMGEAETQHITYQLCDALRYIHSKGVAHRDLKPENILLTKDEPPVVRLADFGLAKVADSMTRLRTMCGTPAYLAPEVILQKAKGGYETVVDSWSVGVIVFSMLTCTSPFHEDSQDDIDTRVRSRYVQWDELVKKNATVGFSIEGAMLSPWLRAYWPVYTFVGRQAVRNGPRPDDWPAQDLEGLSLEYIKQDFKHKAQRLPTDDQSAMSVDEEPSMSQEEGISEDSLFPLSQSQPSQSQGGAGGKLQRRGQVIDEAAEGNGQLPSPSQEMVQNAQLEDRGKRRRDEDSAMLQDDEDSLMESPKKKRASPRLGNGVI